MFCSQCGKQLPENFKFCSNCGAKIATVLEQNEPVKNDSSNQYEEEQDRLLYTFKPEFQGSYVVKKLIPLFLFSTFFISFFITFIVNFLSFLGFGDIFNFRRLTPSPKDDLHAIIAQQNQHDPFGSSPSDQFFHIEYFIIGGLIAFLLVMVWGYHLNKKRYEHSEYKFYTNRMEYIDGYFNFNRKQIHYKNIIEVSMSQNVFQQKYGIGSVRLTNSGMTYSNNRAYSNGITIYDIPNIESAYKKLKQLIK